MMARSGSVADLTICHPPSSTEGRRTVSDIARWLSAGCLLLLVACLSLDRSLAADDAADRLPHTALLDLVEPLDVVMVRGIDRFAERELAASPARRDAARAAALQAGDLEAWQSQQREKLRNIIGAIDERLPPRLLRLHGAGVPRPAPDASAAIDTNGTRAGSTASSVSWDVLPGVTAEGLLLVPAGDIKGYAVAIPDAAWTPEQFCGLLPLDDDAVPIEGLPITPEHLVRHGIVVLVPFILSRDDEFSGNPDIRFTNVSHREHVYRTAFELGRHIVGYEVQKVLAAVDVLERMRTDTHGGTQAVSVCGVGDGGLLAMFAAALDPRIQQTLVCGYFAEREQVWQEPIDRNIWSQLTSLGDAEIASLTNGRLFVLPSAAKTYDGPKPARDGRPDFAAPGSISTPTMESVEREFARLKRLTDPERLLLEGHDRRRGSAVDAFIQATTGATTDDLRQQNTDTQPDHGTDVGVDFKQREKRQLDELVRHTQALLHRSDKVRAKRWTDANVSSVDAWVASTHAYRSHVHNEMVGRLDVPPVDPKPRSRRVIDEPTHTGYEVVLDIIPGAGGDDPGVIAGGILLLPKNLADQERRPVVVCQHGLEGIPLDTITLDESSRAWHAYKGFATQLVQRGFIVYAPQNPYRGEHAFRVLQRKSNPLGRSLFSYIIEQHRVTLKWLATLPNVDAERIAFYGLSYGGKTAVRVPPLLARDGDDTQPVYCLSICSADFNEWIRKNASSEDRYSYVFTKEYEMFEWNMGHVAGYAELASLMIPRPFMVERGHDDGVAPDEWVAWEYAKVRRVYDRLGLGDRTEMEVFDGPHTINGGGTFDFLHRHLQWSAP